MFPGQSSQYVGMGKSWYEQFDIVRERFEEASDALKMDMAKLCFEGPAKILNQTENTQAAIVTLSISMYEALQKELEIAPTYVVGHSIGEVSALTAAGVFKFEDAVRLARVRGLAMSSCSRSGAGMSAVLNLDETIVETIITVAKSEGYRVEIANYNSPTQIVLSGSHEGLEVVGKQLKEMGARVIPLNVSGPFHSSYMANAKSDLSNFLTDISTDKMKIPVICGNEGRLYTDKDDVREILVRQLTEPVRWTKVMARLTELGVRNWLEVGPKEVLKNLVLKTYPSAKAYSYDIAEDQEKIRELKRDDVESEVTPNMIGLCLGAAVATRNKNWDESAYQQGVVIPYKKMEALYRKIESEERKPNKEEAIEALDYLKQIFETKGTPKEEQQVRIQHILNKSKSVHFFHEYEESIMGAYR